MKRGDVIINTLHHTVMYIGNGRIVDQQESMKNGKVSGGKRKIRQAWNHGPDYYFISMDGTAFFAI